MLIYFTCHGETIWNKKGILQGHKNSPLTLKGKKSAEKKGKKLNSENIELIYSSDLGRCVQTSKIINKRLGIKIIQTSELRERNFGNLNGRPIKKVKETLNFNNSAEKAPGGESFNDLKRRTILFIKEISAKNFKKVLLVIHEGTARAILSDYYNNASFNSKKCKTSDSVIYLIEAENGRIKKRGLKIINDKCY